MPGLTKDQIDDIFSYHAPEPGQPERYTAIREAAKHFAKVIIDNTQQCPDQSVAIRKVREAVMVANASIALKGQY